MFEPVGLSLADTFSGVDDAGVVASIGVGAVEENAACACCPLARRRLGYTEVRRLPALDEMVRCRCCANGSACWAGFVND